MNDEEILGCIVVVVGEVFDKKIKNFYSSVAEALEIDDKSIIRFLSLKNKTVATSRRNNVDKYIKMFAKYLEISPYEIVAKAKIYARSDDEVKKKFWKLKEEPKHKRNDSTKEVGQQEQANIGKGNEKAWKKCYVENYKKYIDEKCSVELVAEQKKDDEIKKKFHYIKTSLENGTVEIQKCIKQLGNEYLKAVIDEYGLELIEKKQGLIMRYYDVLKTLDIDIREFLLVLIKIREIKKIKMDVDNEINDQLEKMKKNTKALLNTKTNKDIFNLVSLRYIGMLNAEYETFSIDEIIDINILADSIYLSECDEKLKVECLCKTMNFILVSKKNQKKIKYQLEEIFNKEIMPLVKRETLQEIKQECKGN